MATDVADHMDTLLRITGAMRIVLWPLIKRAEAAEHTSNAQKRAVISLSAPGDRGVISHKSSNRQSCSNYKSHRVVA
jgi:hypothetical protein